MKARTIRLVEEAIKSLQDKGIRVTTSALEHETRVLDPAGTGVNRTTFTKNDDVKSLIAQATGQSVAKALHLDFSKVDIAHLQADRDLRRVLRRLMNEKTKLDLALRVIVLEEEVILLRERVGDQAQLIAEAMESEYELHIKP